MGIIVDEFEQLRCRDCGEAVTDKAIQRQIMSLVFPGVRTAGYRETLAQHAKEATRTGLILVTFRGGCLGCGGGRFAYRADVKKG